MNRKLKIAAVTAAILAGISLGSVAFAASYFSGTVQTATATSTPAYMTPGTATTTLVFNTLTSTSVATATPSNSSNTPKADFVDLLVQLQGSSTAADLHIGYEYSQDGLDWYQDFLPQGGYSTTTQTQTPALDSISVLAASTTYDGTGKTNFDNFVVSVPVPTKDVRIVLTLTGANAAVWAQVIPVKTQ
jgi:hypothetical protein